VGRKRKILVVGGKPEFAAARLGDLEKEMLDRLSEYWGCDRSEAIRRCIVYTYMKFLMGADISEETLSKVVEEYLRFGRLVGRG